jgi:hypothetical protein
MYRVKGYRLDWVGKKIHFVVCLDEFELNLGGGTTKNDVRRPGIGISEFYLAPVVFLDIENPEVI